MKGIMLALTLILVLFATVIFAEIQRPSPTPTLGLAEFSASISSDSSHDQLRADQARLKHRINALINGLAVFNGFEIRPFTSSADFKLSGSITQRNNEYEIAYLLNESSEHEVVNVVGYDGLVMSLSQIIRDINPPGSSRVDRRLHEMRRLSVISSINEQIDDSEMVLIPAGDFMMGTTKGYDDERPPHLETIEHDFYMDKYEVTCEAFVRFLNNIKLSLSDIDNWMMYNDYSLIEIIPENNTWQVLQGYEKYPIFGISQYGAASYCSDQGKRLPTEIEWEYAAKGGTDTEYYWGDEWDSSKTNNVLYGGEKASYYIGIGYWSPSHPTPLPVGQFEENPFGLHDMLGNVWEWTSSSYSVYPNVDDYIESNDRYYYDHSRKVLRGGAFNSLGLTISTTVRLPSDPDLMNALRGFRCVSDEPVE
jgi:formylglycine-generating enzyme required for sulfatase activity